MSSATGPETSATNIAPWLAVSNGEKAVAFYKAAFAAVELYRLEDENQKVAVAQLSIRGAVFWVQHDPSASSDAGGPRSIRLILSVEDPDSVFEKAVAEGSVMVSPMSEGHGWRTARVIDPFGHEWEISKLISS